MAPERAGFDLARLIRYLLPHCEVEIVRLVQPLVDLGNVEIVAIEEKVPRIRAGVHPPLLNGHKAERRSGSTGCNTLGNWGNLVLSMCFSA